MRRLGSIPWILLGAGAALLWPLALLRAQDQQPVPDSSSKPQESSSKKTEPDEPEPYKPQPKKLPKPGAEPPVFDPLRAEKDIEVGRYYMRKGNLEAAMDRFLDATQARPGYALPFRLLGEAQEKKGRLREALKSYTRYLEILPRAEDADAVRKRIERLHTELDKSSRKSN